MKKGKIMSLLVATSITAGTFAGVQVPKIAYAQDENNISSNDEDVIDENNADLNNQEVINVDTTDVNSSDDAIEVIDDTVDSIDLSGFDNQESFQGDYDNIDENGAQAQAIDEGILELEYLKIIIILILKEHKNILMEQAEKADHYITIK